ncbi:MAG: VCBS repeat-containing protein, partial [Deltaproteobacteria bacterium]|nr:VCBS repeat-containing protein [Deltaproteobacteria bacterium]
FTGAWVAWPQLVPTRLNGEGGVIAIADLDGDTAQDVLVTSGDSDELFILRNPSNALGDREFEVSTVNVGSFPFGVVAADLDENQGLDVAVSNGESDDVWVFSGGDGVTLSAPTMLATGGSEPGFVRAADLDGDGRLDLVTSNHSSAQMSVLSNLGAGSFAAAETYPVGNGPSSPAAIDLDGDGDLDVVTANEESATLSVLFNDGGTFSDGGTIDPGGIPFYVQPLDFDGDGDLDIAVPIEDTAEVAFFANDGGTLTEVARTEVGSSPGSMAAGDFNGDGVTDLVVTNYFSDTVSVLLAQPAE